MGRQGGAVFDLVQVWGIPLLNMTYSGALKSTLFGRRKLPVRAHLLLGALILEDMSLLVLCRPDWGPVALGFLLRALFVSAGDLEFYAALARGARGRVLELACGTGRVALALAARLRTACLDLRSLRNSRLLRPRAPPLLGNHLPGG